MGSMDVSQTSLTHGTIVHIAEMKQWTDTAAAIGRSVRVLGRLVNIDVDHSLVTIEYKTARMAIDYELIPGLQPRQGSLFQFIGEVQSLQPLQLRARVGRNIEGMDTNLYDQCLAARRRFDAELERDVLA